MALRQPLFMNLDGSDQTADLFRLMLRDLVNSRPGIIQENAFEVIQRGAGANNSVDVRAGGIIAAGTQSSIQGYYYFVNDATLNVPMSVAAHGTLPRVDSVIVRANDSFYAGSTDNGAVEYVAGTANASPQPPDLELLGYSNYWRLANITIAANDNTINTADISDTRTSEAGQGRATAVGGVIVCTSTSRPSVPRIGQLVWETDSKKLAIWDGSWKTFRGVGSWTSYTPTFGGFFTQPSPRYGRWVKVGNTVVVHGGGILVQSPLDTITATLPLAATNPGNGTRYIGGGRKFNTGPTTSWASIGIITPTTDNTHIRNFASLGSNPWGPGVPDAWGVGDAFDFFATYEAS